MSARSALQQPTFVAVAAVISSVLLLRIVRRPARRPPCHPYVESDKKRCLLISNSKLFGLEYLDHVEAHLTDFLGDALGRGGYVLFVPWAQADLDAYAEKARARFARMGVALRSIHEFESDAAKRAAVRAAAAIFVGGGNTFKLLKALQADAALLPLVRARVNAGLLLYIGSSAGTNVACPTIRNTNDMPIVWPDGLAGLGFVPFQVNTHYIDREREVQHHMGETREKRLDEYFENNALPLVALREGSAIRVEGAQATLLGPMKKSPQVTWDGALLRSADGGARELRPGERLDALMRPPASAAAADVASGAWVARMLDTAESTRAHESDGAFTNG